MSGERGTRYSYSFEVVNRSETQTFQYTGQRQEDSLGLYDDNARFYDPMLGRFTQADTIIPTPGDPQSWDRYAYVKNNPLRYTDPSGRYEFEETPNDKQFVPAIIGSKPARRYLSCSGLTESEAKKIFVARMQDPGRDLSTSDGFGGKNTLNGPGYHPGMDFTSIQKEKKNTPIMLVLSGRIVGVYKNRTGDFGLHIVIEHNIYGIKFYSVYAHLDKILVSVGATVSSKTIIGKMGNTPFEPDGAIHLHLEVRTENNIYLDEYNNFLGLTRSPESYWADTKGELHLNWVDLGLRYGYSVEYPQDWK